MAKTEKLIGIYRGAGLNAPASNLIQMPSLTGTITEVYLDGPEVSGGLSVAASAVNSTRKDIRVTPPSTKTPVQCRHLDAQSPSPLVNGLSNSIMLKEVIDAGVTALLRLSSPAAVFGRVRAVIVDSFKRHSIGALTHIGIIVGEITPTLTHGYSPSTIIVKSLVGRVGASIYHGVPSLIGSCGRHAVPSIRFSLHATTRRGLANAQGIGIDGPGDSASTPAKPQCLSAGLSAKESQDRPSAKGLTRQIYKFSHRPILSQSPVNMGVLA